MKAFRPSRLSGRTCFPADFHFPLAALKQLSFNASFGLGTTLFYLQRIERILAALSRRVGALADDLSAVAAALGELLEYPVASVRKYDTELLESA